MKVPKYIKKSYEISARHYAIAIKHNEIIRDWLNKNNLNNDAYLDLLIDETEMGVGGNLKASKSEFIESIENEVFEIGNDKDKH